MHNNNFAVIVFFFRFYTNLFSILLTAVDNIVDKLCLFEFFPVYSHFRRDGINE